MAKSEKKTPNSKKVVKAQKETKQIEKKAPKPKIQKPDTRKKKKNLVNRNSINVSVDVSILNIFESNDGDKKKNESFKQIALQAGVHSRAIHSRKEILLKLSSTDKERIRNALLVR